MKTLRNALMAMAGFAMAAAASPAANATLLQFGVTPTGLGVGGPAGTFTADELQLTSNALVTQQAGFQQETGYAILSGYQLSGIPIPALTSGVGSTYQVYITFTATVPLSTFTNATATISSFDFTLWADIPGPSVATFTTGSATSGTAPTVNTNGDTQLALAQGSSTNSGLAGFNSNGGATFSVVSDFAVCNGTAGQGNVGGIPVAASDCGSYNAANYFTSPQPNFYAFEFTGSTTAQCGNITFGTSGTTCAPAPGDIYALITGASLDTSFIGAPEPGSIALLGTALVGIGGIVSRRRKQQRT